MWNEIAEHISQATGNAFEIKDNCPVGGGYINQSSAISDGEPVILDPATYYGYREVDIAMSELFGGFPNATWELDFVWRWLWFPSPSDD